MVQKMHPRGVVRGAFFPPPVEIWKKNQLSVLSIYIVVLAQADLSHSDHILSIK